MTGPTSTVSGQIHSRLRADILDGRYAVGEALPSERRLSEELASSRHGVREALKAQIVARAEQLAAVEDLTARNAHYEVLWDLIVEGADNIAYRLALTSLIRQRVASVEAGAVARELGDVP